MALGSILLVEDNPDNARLASWILEDEGYTVAWASSAELGLSMLQEAEQTTYQVILMDISLPGMDGKQAIACVRESGTLRHLPIIAVTAHAILNEREAILKAGADAIVTKPIDEDLLLKTISQLITRQ